MNLSISWGTETTATDPDSGDLIASFVEHLLEFDVVTSETHTNPATLTEHAVEEGAPLSDHKILGNRTISIEAIVTNTPLGAPPPSGYGSTRTVTTTTSPDNVVAFSSEFDRITDVAATLERLQVESTALTVSTRLRTYENVQIVNISEPREADDGDSLRFVLDLQTVRVAQSRSVDSPEPREPRGATREDSGGQEATDATRETSAAARARDEYTRRREAGEDRSTAALGAASVAFGG